jgi:hypothetical protein
LKTSFAVLSLLLLGSCKSLPPVWNGKLWAGSSASIAIERAQDNEAISCAAPEFDNYVCMSYEDFKAFYETYVLGCKKWRKDVQRMTPQEAAIAYGEVESIEQAIQARAD